MGKVGKFIVGALLIVGGIAVGVFTGNWQLGLAIASVGVRMLIAPRVPNDLASTQGAILHNRSGSTQGIPLIYGTSRLAPVIVDIRVDPASTKRKRLVLVMAWCHGSQDGTGIMAIDKVWFDLRLAIDGAAVQTPFSTIAEGATKHLEFAHVLGTSTQVVDTRLNTLFPSAWPSTSRGRGIAYTRFELWFNPDVFGGGVPQIQALIRGVKVYDPRDQTWKFSNNPALCIRDYLTSPIYGLDVPVTKLDEQSFIDMANYCDELVTVPGLGVVARYTLDGIVDTTRPVLENLAKLCTACRGQVVNQGDRWRLVIRRQRAVSGFKMDKDSVLEGSWNFVLPGSEVSNVARVTYVDPDKQYQTDVVEWPDSSQVNPFIAQDGGYESRMEFDLPFTPHRARAQQLAMTMLKETRSGVAATCTLKESAIGLMIGDLVEVTQETPGWADKPFDVLALLLQPDGGVQAVLSAYDATAYDLDAQATPTAPPGTNLPDPFTCPPPTGLGLDGSAAQAVISGDGNYTGRLRVSWVDPVDPFIEFVEVEAKLTTAANYDSWGRVATTGTPEFFIVPAISGSWDVRIRAVNVLKVKSTYVGATAVVADRPPQILTMTLAGAHVDVGHQDVAHQDGGHSDTVHNDTHSDVPHSDVAHSDAAHGDSHTDAHTDVPHQDAAHGDAPETFWDENPVRCNADLGTECGTHQDFPHEDSGHTDTHSDVAHVDTAHADSAHLDSHTDTHGDAQHGDSPHTDSHTDATHGDGMYGIGVAVQADADAGSIKVVARKGGPNLLLNPGGEQGAIGSVYQAAGYRWRAYPTNIPFDSSKLYRIRVRVRRTATTDALTQKFYCGVEGVAADGTTLVNVSGADSFSSQHYIAASDEDASTWTVNVWREYVGWFSGHAATGDSGEFPNSSAPAKLHTNVRFFRPLFIANYLDGPAGNVMQIDYIAVDVFDGTGSLLLETFEAVPTAWNARAGTGTETVQLISATQALGWFFNAGNDLTAATDFFKLGTKSLKIDNPGVTDSSWYQDFFVIVGRRYRISAWIKTSSLPTGDAGFGAVLNVDFLSGVTGWTIISKTTLGADPSSTAPDCGVQAQGATVDWTHVECVFEPTGANGTIRVFVQLGYGGGQSGTAWFDDVWFQEASTAGATPDVVDIRTQPASDGRNVTVPLVDMLTQTMVTLQPGESLVIGGLAYSRIGGTGVEGPRALGRANFFPVAPTGTDKWVPA